MGRHPDVITTLQLPPVPEPEVPKVPLDYTLAKRLGMVRKPANFISTISDDRGEELLYAGKPLGEVLEQGLGIGGVVSLLWFRRQLPDQCLRFIELAVQVPFA